MENWPPVSPCTCVSASCSTHCCSVCLAASATVTIKIDDINDHSPRFVQSVYSATMSENLARGASIISVSATDRDIGSNAKLVYTLREQDREHFYISSIEATNTGVLKVFKVIST